MTIITPQKTNIADPNGSSLVTALSGSVAASRGVLGVTNPVIYLGDGSTVLVSPGVSRLSSIQIIDPDLTLKGLLEISSR